MMTPSQVDKYEDEDEFVQVELIMHRSGDEDEDAEPENCAAPLTCKEKVSTVHSQKSLIGFENVQHFSTKKGLNRGNVQ